MKPLCPLDGSFLPMDFSQLMKRSVFFLKHLFSPTLLIKEECPDFKVYLVLYLPQSSCPNATLIISLAFFVFPSAGFILSLSIGQTEQIPFGNTEVKRIW